MPDRVTAATAPIRRPAHGCYWVVTDRFAHTVHNGCRACTGYYERRAERRRSRHQSHRDLHAYDGS